MATMASTATTKEAAFTRETWATGGVMKGVNPPTDTMGVKSQLPRGEKSR
jgi:hypothetical protein